MKMPAEYPGNRNTTPAELDEAFKAMLDDISKFPKFRKKNFVADNLWLLNELGLLVGAIVQENKQ